MAASAVALPDPCFELLLPGASLLPLAVSPLKRNPPRRCSEPPPEEVHCFHHSEKRGSLALQEKVQRRRRRDEDQTGGSDLRWESSHQGLYNSNRFTRQRDNGISIRGWTGRGSLRRSGFRQRREQPHRTDRNLKVLLIP